jgi:GDP-L-fucose synthase
MCPELRVVETPLAGRRVWVTGGHGFLGRVVVRRLEQAGADVRAPRHADLELLDAPAVLAFARATRPELVVHLAAHVGGIGANARHPGTFWRDNLWMGVNVLEAARQGGAVRTVVVGTVCAYPKFTPVPFREDDLWSGHPEETNAPYGIAKRALATGLQAYRDEFGMAGAYLLPANLYGPGDDFDLQTSHVIPALIRKVVEAQALGHDHITAWGSGRASREFLYVDDCAAAVVAAATHLDDPEPVNVGTGKEITIRALATRIADLAGFQGSIVWDEAKPDGQPRRALDTTRAVERLGWRAATPLDQGLATTIAWYREHRGH